MNTSTRLVMERCSRCRKICLCDVLGKEECECLAYTVLGTETHLMCYQCTDQIDSL